MRYTKVLNEMYQSSIILSMYTKSAYLRYKYYRYIITLLHIKLCIMNTIFTFGEVMNNRKEYTHCNIFVKVYRLKTFRFLLFLHFYFQFLSNYSNATY